MSGAAIVGIPALTAVDGLLGWRAAFVALAAVAVAAALLLALALPGDRADSAPGTAAATTNVASATARLRGIETSSARVARGHTHDAPNARVCPAKEG